MFDLPRSQAIIILCIGSALMLIGFIRMLAGRSRAWLSLAGICLGLLLVIVGGYSAILNSLVIG